MILYIFGCIESNFFILFLGGPTNPSNITLRPSFVTGIPPPLSNTSTFSPLCIKLPSFSGSGDDGAAAGFGAGAGAGGGFGDGFGAGGGDFGAGGGDCRFGGGGDFWCRRWFW